MDGINLYLANSLWLYVLAADAQWGGALTVSESEKWVSIDVEFLQKLHDTCIKVWNITMELSKQATSRAGLYLAVHQQVPHTAGVVFVLQLRVFIRYVPADPPELQYMAPIQVPGNEKATPQYTRGKWISLHERSHGYKSKHSSQYKDTHTKRRQRRRKTHTHTHTHTHTQTKYKLSK